MNKVIINWENYEEYSSYPIEYRFIDSAEIIPGIEGWGSKLVSSQDWYFRVHFPGNPVMPGVLAMETLQQTGLLVITSLPGINEKTMILCNCKNMHMRNSIRPGDVLKTHVLLESFEREIASFYGEVWIIRSNEESKLLACSMKFSLIFQSKIRQQDTNFAPKPFELEEKSTMHFDCSNFDSFLADPPDYRFIDSVTVNSSSGIGRKCLSSLDWYFNLNKDSLMPVGFIMESLMQTGVLIVSQRKDITNPLMMFNDCTELELFSGVRPDEELITYVKMNSFRNGVAQYSGEARVGNRIICKMKFTLIHPDEIKKFSERLKQRSNTQ